MAGKLSGEAAIGKRDFRRAQRRGSSVANLPPAVTIPEVQSDGQFFSSRFFGFHPAGSYTRLLIPTGWAS
jgi:hypothetical protein